MVVHCLEWRVPRFVWPDHMLCLNNLSQTSGEKGKTAFKGNTRDFVLILFWNKTDLILPLYFCIQEKPIVPCCTFIDKEWMLAWQNTSTLLFRVMFDPKVNNNKIKSQSQNAIFFLNIYIQHFRVSDTESTGSTVCQNQGICHELVDIQETTFTFHICLSLSKTIQVLHTVVFFFLIIILYSIERRTKTCNI